MLTVVLDTHAWLWLMSGDPTLRQEAVAVAREAAAAGTLHVSAISTWEVSMLAARGRIVLPQDPLDWVRTSVEQAGIVVAELSPDVLVASTRLPGDLHGDPADRFIAATARRLGAVLITRDRALLAYGAQGHLRALEA